MKTLNEFMNEYDCEDVQAAVYALEDGEFLSTTDLNQEQVEALWSEATQRLAVAATAPKTAPATQNLTFGHIEEPPKPTAEQWKQAVYKNACHEEAIRISNSPRPRKF